MEYNCLIIDDEKVLADSTAEYFGLFGVTAAVCYSAEDCRKFLRDNSTELILLDINLGDGNGFDLCKELRETTNIPILFISARGGDDDKIVALNIGGGTLDVKAQNTSEAQALLSTLFKGAEHEQAEVVTSIQTVEIVNDEQVIDNDGQIIEAQIVPPESDSIAEYKKAKAEMARLGFETLDEYFDYMEFMKVKAKRNYATT